MTADELEAEFAARAVRPAGATGTLLLAPPIALELIARARAAGLPVLGVDGFIVEGDAVVSPLEHLADFSSAFERGDGAWDDAAAFVEARQSAGLVFEVVLDDPFVPTT